jgi:hypothetical protein
MPDEEQLPPGARRDLVTALHELYELAGKPPTRKISADIRDRDDLPGTLSHEGVSAVLRGAGGVPRWQNLESLVRVLVDSAIIERSVEAEVLRVHSLWRIADGGSSSAETHIGRKSYNQDRTLISAESGSSGEQTSETHIGPDDMELAKETNHLGATWIHPRYGRFDFYDKQMVPEVIREVGKLDV